jgi:pimeloyl-ACP methyl ester carboxylesterase
MGSSDQNELPPEGRVARVGDLDMYYELYERQPSYGDEALPGDDEVLRPNDRDETLLLVHGYFRTGRMWSRHIEPFRRRYRVVVPDLRGHGRTANPADSFTHRQSADDVLGLLDHLGYGAVKAMGISTGGMTLTHMATRHPDRFGALVLIGSTSYFPAQARELMRQYTPEDLDGQRMKRLLAEHAHGEEQVRKLNRCFFDLNADFDDMSFTPDKLSTITAPTLIIHGDRDSFFPLEIAVELHRSIRNSYLWIVPNGDHTPYGKLGDEFVRLCSEFLGGEWDKEAKSE